MDNTAIKIFSPGQCLKAAFYIAGYQDLDIPDWFKGEELFELCKTLGLALHTQESHSPIEIEAGTPVIVIYNTRENRAHAEYADDLGPLIQRGERLVAIVELPKNRVPR